MKRSSNVEFELPDDWVVGAASGDEEGRMGAGSTLPQDLYPLGVLGGVAGSAAARPGNDGETLPPDLAPAAGAVSEAAEPAPVQAIIAPPRVQGGLPQDGPQHKRVLVVDDDLTMRLYMRSRLMLRGHVQLLEAGSGEEAIQMVQAQRFDAVLLDVDMGKQNGYETCRAVRSHVRREGGKQPRIYIITSRSSVIDKLRAKMAGADAFLSKPPHPGELAELLAQL
jgi:CheY-like chemotaxis protein